MISGKSQRRIRELLEKLILLGFSKLRIFNDTLMDLAKGILPNLRQIRKEHRLDSGCIRLYGLVTAGHSGNYYVMKPSGQAIGVMKYIYRCHMYFFFLILN